MRNIDPKNQKVSRQQLMSSKYRQFSRMDEWKGGQIERQLGTAELEERLRNIHHYYSVKIEEERKKNAERSDVIISLVEEMQVNHNIKMTQMKEAIASAQQKKDSPGFDQKIHEIQISVDDLIKQSETLKSKNNSYENQINSFHHNNIQKQKQLQNLNEELIEARNALEEFQMKNLKNNKINRDILELFKTATSLQNHDH